MSFRTYYRLAAAIAVVAVLLLGGVTSAHASGPPPPSMTAREWSLYVQGDPNWRLADRMRQFNESAPTADPITTSPQDVNSAMDQLAQDAQTYRTYSQELVPYDPAGAQAALDTAAADDAAVGVGADALAAESSLAATLGTAMPLAAVAGFTWYELCDNNVISFGCELFGRDDTKPAPFTGNLNPVHPGTFNDPEYPTLTSYGHHHWFATTGSYFWSGVGGMPTGLGFDPGQMLGTLNLVLEQDLETRAYCCDSNGNIGAARKGQFWTSMQPTTQKHLTAPDGLHPTGNGQLYGDGTDFANTLQDAVDSGDPQRADGARTLVAMILHVQDANTYPSDPGAQMSTMPDCTGKTAQECIDALHAAGFQDVTVNVLDFNHADPTRGANQTVSIGLSNGAIASPGTQYSADAVVTVNANPDTPDMPVLVPQPTPHELEAAYEDDLKRVGLVAAPQYLSDTAPNQDYGPNEVVKVDPRPGTRAHQGDSIAPTANPSSAPMPPGDPNSNTDTGTASGTTTCGLTAPSSSLDTGPLQRLNASKVFPFSVVAWLGSAVAASLPSQPPNATFTLLGTSVDLSWLSNLEPVTSILRLVLAGLMWLGVAWFLYGRTFGKDT